MAQKRVSLIGKKKIKPTKNDSKKSMFDWIKKLNIFNKSESKKKDDKNK